jgi:DNA-binding NarL/FixJ family response regulator
VSDPTADIAYDGPSATVLVIERLPAYRRGLAAALAESGFVVGELGAVEEPMRAADAIVLTVDCEESWAALVQVVASGLAVVALLEDSGVSSYRRALRLGVAGAVGRDAPTEQIVAVVRAALDRKTLIPCPIARRLADRCGAEEPLPISDSEARWLRAMAEGTTIASMAQGARYSERQMHRLIAKLYKRIGAANRQQALVFAARHGILDS